MRKYFLLFYFYVVRTINWRTSKHSCTALRLRWRKLYIVIVLFLTSRGQLPSYILPRFSELTCKIWFLSFFAVSGFYAECPSRKLCFNAHIWTKSKFYGMSIGVVNQGVGKWLDQQLFSSYNMLHNVKWTGDENNNNNQLAVDVQYRIVAIQSLFVQKLYKCHCNEIFVSSFIHPNVLMMLNFILWNHNGKWCF